MPPITPDELLAALEDTWRGTAEVCDGLADAEWALPSGCPGWTVKDNVSHIVGIESAMSGAPAPDHRVPDRLAHIRNEIGAYMEVQVDVRRPLPGDEVLAEFRKITAERLSWFRSFAPGAWDDPVPGPMGSPAPLRAVVGLRVFDCWAHEQDIRRALDRAGGLDGPAGLYSRDRVLKGLAILVANKGLLAEGQSLAVEITGPGAVAGVATVDEGKGRWTEGADAGSGEPVAHLRLGLDALAAHAFGRADAGRYADSIEIEGDRELGRRILAEMAMTP